jgi:glycosyltransferase involved in cell wall biosynthesis
VNDAGPALSAVVLCYRASASIRRVVDPLYRLLDEAGVDFELVLVANYWPGTDDDTPRIVEELATDNERIRTVVLPKAGAMGWDMRSGLEAARGRLIVALDGDAQNPVADVLEMYRRLEAGEADVMKGRRVRRFDGLYREVVSLVYNVAFRLLFRTRGLWDINGKPKGLTRAAYERMTLRSDDWFIDAEIVLAARRLGLTVAEMPVVFHATDRGSFVRVSAIGEFLVNMVVYRLLGRTRS